MSSYKLKILLTVCLCMIYLIMYAQSDQKKKLMNDPFHILGMNSDSLMITKPGGAFEKIQSKSGQNFSVINYDEDWFGFGKLKAKYFIVLNKIVQISFRLPKNTKNENAQKTISNYLGKPCAINVAKKDTMPRYSAQWIVGGVSYGFNDYGDSSLIYISKSMLYNYNVYYIPAGSYIVQKISVDLNGDAIKDEISLIGHRFDESAFFFDQLFFIMKDGKTKKETVTPFPKEFNSGYNPQISTANFTNKKYPEIFFTSPTGGSGGIINYLVFSFKSNKGKAMFLPDTSHIINITGEFDSNYSISFTIKQTNKKYTLNIEDEKPQLDNMKIYEKGIVIKKADVWINAYGLMEIKDVDKDGLMELTGIQAIKAAANYITVGKIKSTWKFIRDQFHLINAEISETKY